MEPKYASKKNRKAPERYSGGYSLIPHDVLDSPAYTSCSPRAKALLIDVARQHNGRNNGHMQLTQTWLARRGWKSVDQINKGWRELIQHNLIYQTKQGGLNNGPNFFALTWYPVSNKHGLDQEVKNFEFGAWKRPFTENTKRRTPPRKTANPSVQRCDTLPTSGSGNPPPHPPSGAVTNKNNGLTKPRYGDNENYHS